MQLQKPKYLEAKLPGTLLADICKAADPERHSFIFLVTDWLNPEEQREGRIWILDITTERGAIQKLL